MISGNFQAKWPEYFDVKAEIDWTQPVAHSDLFSGAVQENETAYFYSIVALDGDKWLPYYIGMTFNQTAAIRNKQIDHSARLERLKLRFPEHKFMITLGTPRFELGSITQDAIGAIEGLLIYGNWHSEMDNVKKVQTFNSIPHVFVRNVGWSEHVEPELAFGVFHKNRA